MSVRRAQQEISAAEFAEWQAYNRLEPSGPDTEDLRFGALCALIANSFRGKGRAAKPEDFMMVDRTTTPEEQSVAVMKANLAMYLKTAGVEPKVG